ncbi:MAG: ribonuclease D [Proteobacteria bacterium]|nr:ribonuclease D [Pseudomonadota bacterium]
MHYRGGAISTEFILSNADLASAATQWRGAIGVDTEFIRTDTYFPIPGLYQVCCGSSVHLIDPLSIDDWGPFQDALIDPDIVKVMHACSEDLELMSHHLDLTPVGIWDTQVARAFLDDNFSVSYAGLVEAELSISLGKHETRSDWLARPLSAQQVKYAAEDVIHLVNIFERQTRALQKHGRLAWFEEDMAERATYDPVAPVDYYRNVKKAWRLNGNQLSVLKALCAWREQEARRSDVPRRRVVWDEHLYHFATVRELNTSEVEATVPRSVARRHAATLVDVHNRALRSPAVEQLERPLTPSQGGLMRQLRERARLVAAREGIAVELLARKKDVEECVRCHISTGELSARYLGWRHDLVGPAFKEVLA